MDNLYKRTSKKFQNFYEEISDSETVVSVVGDVIERCVNTSKDNSYFEIFISKKYASSIVSCWISIDITWTRFIKIFYRRLSLYATQINCILLYGTIHGCIDQLIPANYLVFERKMGLNPVILGTVAFFHKTTFTVACPFWGLLVDNFDTSFIMKYSLGPLGLCIFFLSICNSYEYLCYIMCFCGFFSASLGPLSQKIISETSEHSRGKYFGRLMFYQAIGRQIALFITGVTSNYLSNREYNHWFCPFGFSSILCFLFSIYVTIFLKCDTININNNSNFQLKLIFSNLKNMSYICKSKTVHAIFLLGLVNAIPRGALNFVFMWLQNTGLSSFNASIVISVSWISAMIVAPLVGLVSDIFYQMSPSRGRSVMAQVSLIFRCIFIIIFIAYVPILTSQYKSEIVKLWIFSFVSFCVGMFAGWPGIGACRPILSEIVLPSHKATVFAFSSMFEGIGSAFLGTRLVGDLAVCVFGYHLLPNNTESESITDSLRNKYLKENSKALGNAILCMTVIPWIVSIALFSFTKKKESKEKPSNSKVYPQLTIINSQLDYLLKGV
ncbi:hypothetical protein ACR3K2_30440 [Cryptosporidium serpentis]